MRLNAKVYRVLLSGALILIAIFAIGIKTLLIPRFDSLEDELLRQNHDRLTQLLDSDLRELERLAQDWSVWDETFNFLQGKNPDFINNNITPRNFELMDLESLMLFDRNNQLAIDITFERSESYFTHQTRDFIQALTRDVISSGLGSLSRGFFEFHGRTYLVARSPVYDSSGTSASVGQLVMLRALESNEIERLSSRLRLSIHFYRERDILENPNLSQLWRGLGRADFIKRRESDRLLGYSLLYGMHQQPILLMEIEMPPTIFQNGKKAVWYFSGFFLAALALLMLLVSWALRRSVLDRLQHLNDSVRKIGEEVINKAKIPDLGDDEIGQLARGVNLMLSRLEHSAFALRSSSERQREQNALLVQLATSDAMNSGDVDSMHRVFEEALRRGAHVQRASIWLSETGSHDDELQLVAIESWHCQLPNLEPSWLASWFQRVSRSGREYLVFEPDDIPGYPAWCFAVVLSNEWFHGLVCFESCRSAWPADEENFLLSAALLMEQFQLVRHQRERARELKRRAEHDPLTGLWNRAAFEAYLPEALRQAQEDAGHLAILFLDLDRFKPINDEYGHAVGDWLLIQVGKRLREAVRGHDRVARLGGDEFILLLSDLRENDVAEPIARKLVASLNQPFQYEGFPLQIGCSIGIAFYPEHGSRAEELLAAADRAMYLAKQAGRNTYRIGPKAPPAT